MKSNSILRRGVMAAAACMISATMTTSAWAADEGSIARGGKLYDKWYKVLKVDAPSESHKLYPSDKKYADKPGANWRCKECHGWDGLGRDGAYSSGSHASGIVGINGKAGADAADIKAILTGDAHGFGDKLSDADLTDLANFVSAGQVDMSKYVNAETKAVSGDAAHGKAVYDTMCMNCHGADGKLPKDMKPFGAQMSNPWEVMHKILNGQPGEQMPALRALDHQISADVMAYLVTLPKE